MIPFGLPSLNGIILGAVLYTALMAISKQRVTTNLAEEAQKGVYQMDRYKLSALIGTVIMGIGSFMGCLAENPVYINTGNALLVVSILIMIYGYSRWQP